ncbi:hypothetical protein [uncultured Psychromonas sp.]|uniref:hypothetical protein n=1 Tax=uncultured Psychromonas sp. TaxID=173974 RepID=UPI002607189A|nr:hypothetical protein [uncultured Psychromonas sp.]
MNLTSYQIIEHASSTFSEGDAFHLGENCSEQTALFRLLSGSCDIYSNLEEEQITQNTNFFFSDITDNTNTDLSFLDDFEEGITFADYQTFMLTNRFRNRGFYKNVLNEMVAAIYHYKKNNHTAAFVHLYRTYEHLSYAFPMIYSARTDDYLRTFENLRNWMTNSKSDSNVGELKFHKSFVATLFKNTPELASTIDIEITSSPENQEILFNTITKKVLGWKTVNDYTSSTIHPNKIAVSFSDFHSFIITLRNRFFHYSNARSDNIKIEEILDSNFLFSLVNGAIIYFISTIFHGVVRHNMS